MPNRFFSVLAAILLTGVTPLPSIAVPGPFFQLAKEEEKPPDALVTEVEILKENFADTWFYTLRGSLKNQSDATIFIPLIYYEIYSTETDQIVEAGTAMIEPKLLPVGKVGTFQQELNTGGKVKITLVQWQQKDKSVESHKQMQFFPLETQTSESAAEDPASQPIPIAP